MLSRQSRRVLEASIHPRGRTRQRYQPIEKPRVARQLFPSVYEAEKHPVRLSVACGINEEGEFMRTESESMELALGAAPGAQGTSLVWAFKKETRLSVSFGSLVCEGGDSRDFPMRTNAPVILFPDDLPTPMDVALTKAALVLFRPVTVDATRWTPAVFTPGTHGLPDATTRRGSSGTVLHVRGIQLHGEVHVDFTMPGPRFANAGSEPDDEWGDQERLNMVVATVQVITIAGEREMWEHIYPLAVVERLAEPMNDARGIIVNSAIIEIAVCPKARAAV